MEKNKVEIMFVFTVGVLISLALQSRCVSSINNRPIIGVLVEELNSTIVPDAKSHILASYVKFLETGGSRVVPIWINKPRKYYEDIMSKINGVLFPGGGNILTSQGYGRSGQLIFDIATKMNDKGVFFPLWGTCLGFELMNFLVTQKLWMKACNAEDLLTNIEFVEGYKDSRMFQNLEKPLERIMQTEESVIHYHRWCLTPENYTRSGLDNFFKVLAVGRDRGNVTFVSVIEAYDYPFYATFFHPEKVLFEWIFSNTHSHIPHTLDAIRVNQYFANFFVNEARNSSNQFDSKESENAALIYNYNPVFTGQYGTNPNIQTYYFTS